MNLIHLRKLLRQVIFVYPDTNEFREKCQPLLDSIANQSDMTKDIYNKVEALREEN